MFTIPKPSRPWSEIGIYVLIGSIVASVTFAILDGVLHGLSLDYGANHPKWVMFWTWAMDFRYLADQAIYASTIFIVGAKFIETRTIFSVGFDKLDANQVAFRGPTKTTQFGSGGATGHDWKQKRWPRQ